MAAFNKERTAKLIDPKWLGKDFNPSDEEQLTTQRLNTYLVDCIDSYMEGEFLDDILFLNLKDDFPDWTEEHFKLTDKTLRSNFKNYLKDHGIYIGNNGSVSAEITLALRQNKCPEWPEEEAERYRQFRKEKFQSYRNNPGFDKPDYNSPTPTKKAPSTTTKASKVKKIDKGKKVAENPNPDDDDSSDSSSDDGSHDRRSDGDNDGGGDPSDGGQESPIKEISRSFKNASITPAPAFPTTTSKALTDLGKLERYHGPLRRAYEVITADLQGTGTTAEYTLQMAVKAVNDTAGPDGLVPTLLVFGTYPRMTDSSPPSPSIEARANVVRKAMAEVRKLKVKRQVDGALATRNCPNTLDTLNLPLQSEVKVWREHRGWTGPHTLLSRNSEKCTVDINGSPTDFRIVVVTLYYRDETTDAPDPDDDLTPDNDDGDREWMPQEDIPAPNEPKKSGKG